MSKARSHDLPPSPAAGSNGSNGAERVQYVDLSEETRRRYLNYALSVITARALPDVRDGLKPVQRRILYTMYNELHLGADAKTRKCALICGETMGKYHPHGDQAIYDALVRLAQDFTLRNTLVIGQGNFGSIIGLPPAAPRYTEAKLSAIADHLMNELKFRTVEMRPNYDASRQEPVVLPARFPNILVNGAQGIAVGMATNIPPHNLGEVIQACLHVIEHPDASVAQVMKFIKGPDFPLGGRIVTDRTTLRRTYEEGRGSIKVRAEWKPDRQGRKEVPNRLVVYSIPYGVETGPLMTELNALVEGRRLPQLVAATDETAEKTGLRIVLELKPGADPEAVMAYLYKHTALEQNFAVNTTCLVPDDRGLPVPARLNLVEILRHFLEFRLNTVRRRFEFQLEQLLKRIHILEGFAIVFNDLDKALKLIRTSQGKTDAAQKLMKAFPLDEDQTNAILEIALYRISQLEVDRILEELADKRTQAEEIRRILASERRLWKVVGTELQELADQFADPRRTMLGSSDEIAEYDPQAYIVRENVHVVITRDGWIKRVGRLLKVESTRVREGDEVLAVVPGSTQDCCVFFASDGMAYTLPIDQIPASTGYGEPLSKHVKLRDGASIVSVVGTDPRFTPQDKAVCGQPAPAPYVLVVTAQGQALRVPLSPFRQPSHKSGRKFCRLRTGDRVVFAELVRGAETMFIATRQARVLHCRIDEIPVLTGPGKGVRGMRVLDGDEVLGAVPLARPSDCLRVINAHGKQLSFGQMKYGVTSRGGKGVKTSQRTDFLEIVRPPIELVDWAETETE